MGLGEKVVLGLMKCLTPSVSFYIFITISHLFVLELTTFEPRVILNSQRPKAVN